MADYRVTDTQLSSIANAIRTKGGTSASLVFPSGFVSAVENIPTGVLISKTISQNGSYRATDDNADGYSDVIVNVSGGSSPILISKSISQNGTYNPSDDNADAYSQVVVNVSGGGGGEGLPAFILDGGSGVLSTSVLSKIREYGMFLHSSVTSVSLDNVGTIGSNAFAYCIKLKNVDCSNCLTIGASAFLQCTSLSSISFPTCQNINEYAFSSCTSLGTISFPQCVSIGNGAFASCRNVYQIILPNCESIGDSCFRSCVKVSQVYTPKCKRIGSRAFGDCSKFESMYISTSNCVLVNSNAFMNTAMINSALLGGRYASVYVPSEYVDAYKSAAQWSFYSDRISAYPEQWEDIYQ